MGEKFGIASFRSRQQVIQFESVLKRNGIDTQIITTPRQVSAGCGLSVRFSINDLPMVQKIGAQMRPVHMIGIYVVNTSQGRMDVGAPQ